VGGHAASSYLWYASSTNRGADKHANPIPVLPDYIWSTPI
jgi:hypothetical protein